MTDVRLTATNPDDSSVVPVACNAKGELLLEELTLSADDFVAKTGDNMTGNLTLGTDKITLSADGSATFAREVVAGVRDVNSVLMTSSGTIQGVVSGESRYSLTGDGRATFTNDVVIGSRNKKWMIVESNGIAHLVEQTRVSVSADVPDVPDEPAVKYPELRNIPQELDLIEQALGEVMEKLRMNPPAGWEVWDGSSENS